LDKHIKFPLFTKSSPHKPSEKRTKIPWFHSSCWQKIFQMTPEPLYRLSMSACFGVNIVSTVIDWKMLNIHNIYMFVKFMIRFPSVRT
jgi:hypothetical protein